MSFTTCHSSESCPVQARSAAIVADSAPTASLVASLEMNHVYDLMYASISYHLSSSVVILIREVRHSTSAANFSMRYTQPTSLLQTYGPFTRNYDSERPSTLALPLQKRARIMARQGHALANADEVRGDRIYHNENVHGGDRGDVVKDVVDGGEAVGKAVVRGNTVMEEVSAPSIRPNRPCETGYVVRHATQSRRTWIRLLGWSSDWFCSTPMVWRRL